MLKEQVKYCPFCGGINVKESMKTKTGVLCNCQKCKSVFTIEKPEFKRGNK